MSELGRLFGGLRGAPPPGPFASPEQVRQRGRQRGRRQAMAASAAVILVVGLVAGWALIRTPAPERHPPAATNSPTPATSPPPAVGVPASVMLRPLDFDFVEGVTTDELDDQGPDGTDWPWAAKGCAAYRPADYPSLKRRLGVRNAVFMASENWRAVQIVERYADGPANMSDVRRVLTACARYRIPDGVNSTFTVVDQRFVGDDSLLVLIRSGENPRYHVVVRVGNLVSDLQLPGDSEGSARKMATVVADRLHSS